MTGDNENAPINLNYVRERRSKAVASEIPHWHHIERGLAVLEADLKEVRANINRVEPLLFRVDERINHLPTKQELILLRSDIGGELASKATRETVWVATIVLSVVVASAFALASLCLPYLENWLHHAPPL
jgi:hypothetical protein